VVRWCQEAFPPFFRGFASCRNGSSTMRCASNRRFRGSLCSRSFCRQCPRFRRAAWRLLSGRSGSFTSLSLPFTQAIWSSSVELLNKSLARLPFGSRRMTGFSVSVMVLVRSMPISGSPFCMRPQPKQLKQRTPIAFLPLPLHSGHGKPQGFCSTSTDFSMLPLSP
jgi:hypothetical protein